MRQMFRGYYTPSPDELKALWKECTFVLDANVLLNLYRYPKEAREDFLRLLRQVQDRLWIPHQAALEYQRNRLEVIAQQVKRFGEVRGILAGIRGKLRSDLEKLQIRKRHPSIDPEKLLTATDAAFADFEKKLEAFEKEQPDVFDDDRIRATLDELLASRIGPPPDQTFLDAIAKEGKARFEQKRPPGYEDAKRKSEEEVYFAGGLVFHRLYGDLILWHEILAAAKDDEKLKKIIFVTDDQKEDWWWIVDSQGKKRVGPRPELVDGMFTKGGVTGFYMYNSERFLEFAKANLGVSVKPESIEQVRDVASYRIVTSEDIVRSYNLLEAVSRWLRGRQLYEDVWQPEEIPASLVAEDKEGRKTAYDIYTSIPVYESVHEAQDQAADEIRKGSVDEWVFVFVLDTLEDAERSLSLLKSLPRNFPPGARYIVGTLSPENVGERTFMPLATL